MDNSYLHLSSIDLDNDKWYDLSTMDPKTGVEKIIKDNENLRNLLGKAVDASEEASKLISNIKDFSLEINNNEYFMLSNIRNQKKPEYIKIIEDYKNYILVDIRNAKTKCCQGCGAEKFKTPERPSIPHEIVLKEDNSSTIYIMNISSVCVDCLPDMSVVTVISHAWEPKKERISIKSFGTGNSKVSITRKIVAALSQISGWIWVDALCDQSSADSNMRTRMYATCKLGVFTEDIKGLYGELTAWHQRLWCLIEAMYCRKIAIIVIGEYKNVKNIENEEIEGLKINNKKENVKNKENEQINNFSNMYGWFYATCRLFRISLNDRDIRQKK